MCLQLQCLWCPTIAKYCDCSVLYMHELKLLRLTKHSPPFIIFSIFTLLLVSASSWLIVCVSLKIFPQLGPSPVKYIWIYSDLNISRYLRFIRQGNIIEILFLTPHLVIAGVSATSCWSPSWTSRRGSKWYHLYLRSSSSRSTPAGSFSSWPRTGCEYFYYKKYFSHPQHLETYCVFYKGLGRCH